MPTYPGPRTKGRAFRVCSTDQKRLAAVIFVGALLVLLRWQVGWGAPPAFPRDVARCAECHEEEVKQWRDSPHAHSINPAFLGEWGKQGRKWECVVCHTSHYDRRSGAYSEEGVGCESCHGVVKETHPSEERVSLPVSSDACQSCHAMTYGEWRISAHGQKGIRCFDCHRMHRMALRKEDPDQMCGSCHTERLRDFAHATHRIKGLKCITCHMPEVPGGAPKIIGTGVRAHTSGVGGETCANCHREMVHEGSQIETLKHEVQRLKSLDPVADSRRLTELEGEAGGLRDSLDATKRVFVWVVPGVFLLGAGSGAAISMLLERRHRKAS